jgi:murein peptide amidase A
VTHPTASIFTKRLCANKFSGYFRPKVNDSEWQLETENSRRSIERLLEPLVGIPSAQFESLGAFDVGPKKYSLPRFTLRGPNSSDPIRIGIFAGIHGDEPAGTLAAAKFLIDATREPAFIENFLLNIYPLCNPSGYEDNTRHSRRGKDLNREFWKSSTEPEIAILERELRTQHFNGIIQLHADDTSDGIYGFVRGHTLTENLLRPALSEAGKILPRNVNATIDGFAARDGIIYTSYEGILAAPMQSEPPFEIILETPHHAPMDLQVDALVVAIRTILTEYRRLISFAANL